MARTRATSSSIPISQGRAGDLDVRRRGGGHGEEGESQDQSGAGDYSPGPTYYLDDSRVGVAGSSVLLRHPGQNEHLLVHRETDEEGNDQHRDNVTALVVMDRLGDHPPLPEHNQHTERRRYRCSVEEHCFHGQHDRPEWPSPFATPDWDDSFIRVCALPR